MVSIRKAEAATPRLTERQASVLRAVVTGYVGEASPIGSKTISHLLPVSISSASIRSVLAELTELGLVEQPHRSAGRIPTEFGLRLFVDELLSPARLAASQRRELAYQLDDAHGDDLMPLASEILSRHTRQLGFVVAPRLDRVVLTHVSLVRLSSERLLVVLISRTGTTYRRVIDNEPVIDQRELDRVAAVLSERVLGRTLVEVRELLTREAALLQREADDLQARAVEIGRLVLAGTGPQAGDLVIETRLGLLEQPEFNDPRRLRDLFEAIETKERLLSVLDGILEQDGVSVAIGREIDDPSLRGCALVATSYGGAGADESLGALGVIGPSRMDFGRIIPLVDYVSTLMTERLCA